MHPPPVKVKPPRRQLDDTLGGDPRGQVQSSVEMGRPHNEAARDAGNDASAQGAGGMFLAQHREVEARKGALFDYPALAAMYFGSAGHAVALRNIMSWIGPYRRGQFEALRASTTGGLLKTLAQHARYLGAALRRIDTKCLTEQMSPRLQGFAEWAVPANPAAAAQAMAGSRSVDPLMWAAARARQRDHVTILRSVIASIEAVAADPTVTGLARGRVLLAASKHARGMRETMARIDIRDLAALLPAMAASGGSVTLADLADLLDLLATAAANAAGAVVAPMGRPGVPDPIRLGVESLVRLWQQTHGRAPTLSSNADSLSVLCQVLFGAKGLGCADSAVRTCVRQVIAGSATQTG